MKQSAYRFFCDNARLWSGGIERGPAKYAKQLAVSERAAKKLGYYFSWGTAPDVACSLPSPKFWFVTDVAYHDGQEYQCIPCIMRDSAGEVVQARVVLVYPDCELRRVVEAELALQEFEKPKTEVTNGKYDR